MTINDFKTTHMQAYSAWLKAALLILTISLFSCRPHHQIVTEHIYKTHYIDSIIIKDSIITIPKETYTNLTWRYDTLHLSTSLATAEAWVDSIWLKGTMTNKDKVQTEYIDRWHIRDSVVYEKVPEPYPVETIKTKNAAWPIWLWAILSSCALVAFVDVWLRQKFRL